VKELRNTLTHLHEITRQVNRETALQSKKNYDIKAKPSNIQVGDLVTVLDPKKKSGLTRKLMRNFSEPYTVVQRISEVTFRIRKSPKSRIRTIHADRLRLVRRPPPSLPVIMENEKTLPTILTRGVKTESFLETQKVSLTVRFKKMLEKRKKTRRTFSQISVKTTVTQGQELDSKLNERFNFSPGTTLSFPYITIIASRPGVRIVEAHSELPKRPEAIQETKQVGHPHKKLKAIQVSKQLQSFLSLRSITHEPNNHFTISTSTSSYNIRKGELTTSPRTRNLSQQGNIPRPTVAPSQLRTPVPKTSRTTEIQTSKIPACKKVRLSISTLEEITIQPRLRESISYERYSIPGHQFTQTESPVSSQISDRIPIFTRLGPKQEQTKQRRTRKSGTSRGTPAKKRARKEKFRKI